METDEQPTPWPGGFSAPLTEASTSPTLPVLGPDLIQGDQASWGHCSPCRIPHGQVSPLPDLGAAPGLDQITPPACLCSPSTQATLQGHPPGGQSSSPSPAPSSAPTPPLAPGWQASLPPKFCLFLLNSPKLTSGPQPPLLLAERSPTFR